MSILHLIYEKFTSDNIGTPFLSSIIRSSSNSTLIYLSSFNAHIPSLRFAVSVLASHLSAEVLFSRFALDRTTVALRLRLRFARLRQEHTCLCGSLFPLWLRTLCSPIADSYRMVLRNLLSLRLHS